MSERSVGERTAYFFSTTQLVSRPSLSSVRISQIGFFRTLSSAGVSPLGFISVIDPYCFVGT